MERIQADKREEWDAMLEAPLPGQERRPTPMQAEDESAGFMALMGMAGQGGIAGGVR